MAAVRFATDLAVSVRNTFLHCAEEEDSSPMLAVAQRRRLRTLPAGAFAAPQAAAAVEEEVEGSEESESEGTEEDAPIPSFKTRDSFDDEEDAGPGEADAQQPLPTLLRPRPLVLDEVAKPAAQALPSPMYVPQQPRLSVRNTFLHIDDEEEADAEEAVTRGRRRSKTQPAAAFVEQPSGEESGGEEVCRTSSDSSSSGPEAAPPVAEVPAAAPVAAEEVAPPEDWQERQPCKVAVTVLQAAPVFAVLAPFLAAMPQQPPQAPQAPPAAPKAPDAGPRVAPAAAASADLPEAEQRPTRERTTVVLQNLPLNYRRSMLLRMLDAEGFSGAYDFVYLPMDFRTRAGFGYAFVNLVDAAVVPRFWRAFDGYRKWLFPSAKVCRVGWSVPQQGLKAQVRRYRNSPLMHESVPDEYKPVLFSAGARVAFPPPTKPLLPPSQQALVKAPRQRR